VSTETDRIILEGMTFYGYHGDRPEERALGQRFVVDLEVGADLARAGDTDELSDTINYSELYEDTRTILEGEPLRLIEAVAERVATAALARERVLWVRVRVSKPSVAIPGVLRAAAVEIVRFREGGGHGD
jgi:dihydroneopterin aldolase